MYDQGVRRAALWHVAQGASLNSVSKQLGISRAAITAWTRRLQPLHVQRNCVFDHRELNEWAYSHLLGLYLGDGYINRMQRDVHLLRICCDNRYPRVIAEATLSMHRVRPAARIFLAPQVGCTSVAAYWKLWPAVFPQHGPGKKHTRPIVLEPWQREIVERQPGRFLRGLFHSDGCRLTNWTVKIVAGTPKRYEYPRYFFSNQSADILGLCGWALDRCGIPWRYNRADCISVARRDAVAALDTVVGPKT